MTPRISGACVFRAIRGEDEVVNPEWQNLACFTCRHIIDGLTRSVNYVANAGVDADELIAMCGDKHHHRVQEEFLSSEFGFVHIAFIKDIDPEAFAIIESLDLDSCARRNPEGGWLYYPYRKEFD